MPVAQISGSSVDLNLRPFMTLLEDKAGTLDFAQVRALAQKGAFSSMNGVSPAFGFTTSAWWVRVTLHNTSSEARELVIRQDYPLIDHLDFWAPAADGGWHKISTGDGVPFGRRPLNHREFLFPIKLPPQGAHTYYLRFQTQGSMNIGLHVHSVNNLFSRIGEEYLALGIYYGGFIVLLVTNLILFFLIRERAFAYYALYVLSYGIYMSVHNGLSFQYLWPNNPWLANQSLIITLALSLFGCLRFTREILRSKELCPRADRIAFGMEVIVLLTLVIGPFLSYHTVIVPLALMTSVICLHMLVLCILTLIRGSGPARYYLAAFSALLGGVLVYMLKTFGLMPYNAITENAFQVGSLIEMVLLSLAIGARMNELKLQNNLDALTRLHNRRYFNEQIEIEFQKAGRRSQPLSLLVLDIDRFKQFNDSHGHARGDQALKAVAQVLASTTRKPFISCRYGGEEFAVILPDTDESGVAVLAERVRDRVMRETADSFALTVSIGHATEKDRRFADPLSLFQAADSALYTAKENGRNQVIAYRDYEAQQNVSQASGEPAVLS